MSEWKLRVRGALARNLTVVVVALVILALLGGWLTYTTYAAPDTTTEQRVVSTWETSGAFDHGATVVAENDVFPVGSRLENRSVYFTRIAPVLEGSYAFSYRASQQGDLSTTVNLSLAVRGVEGEGAGDQADAQSVLWETKRPLNERSVESVGPGETVRVPFSVDVSEVANATDRITEDLGGTPGTVQTRVEATVGLRGQVNGRPVERTVTYALPVTPENGRYVVEYAGPTTDEYESTRPVTAERSYGPLRRYGAPLLLVAALAGETAVALAQSRNWLELSPAEREWLAYRDDRGEFDEWITAFDLPDEAFDRPRAAADSLGDLVDFAIDVDSGVVEVEEGHFVVLYDGTRYEYRAPSPPESVSESAGEADLLTGSTTRAGAGSGDAGHPAADAVEDGGESGDGASPPAPAEDGDRR
jgi:hypothetical protein